MDKIDLNLNIQRQLKALRAMREAQSPVFKHFWFGVFGKVLSKSIIKNEDGVPYDSETRN